MKRDKNLVQKAILRFIFFLGIDIYRSVWNTPKVYIPLYQSGKIKHQLKQLTTKEREKTQNIIILGLSSCLTALIPKQKFRIAKIRPGAISGPKTTLMYSSNSPGARFSPASISPNIFAPLDS